VAIALFAVSALTHYRRARTKDVLLRVAVLVGIVAFTLLSLPIESGSSALAGVFLEKVNATGTTNDDVSRIALGQHAIGAFFGTSGLGLGTGGFGVEFPIASTQGDVFAAGGIPGRNYPHNIFLEAMAELGIVGLALMIAWVKRSLDGLKRIARAGFQETSVLVGLWVFALVNSCVSGDFVSNVPVWVLGAIPWFVRLHAPSRPASGSTITVPHFADGRLGDSHAQV
jgi:O-antigen ligase